MWNRSVERRETNAADAGATGTGTALEPDPGSSLEQATSAPQRRRGFIESYGGSSGTESSCVSNYIYSVSGDVLTIEELYDSGFTSAVTADFSISGDTLSLTPADGGFSVVYTRVNAYSSNLCP